MLDLQRVQKEDRLLRAFTGLNKAFDELTISFGASLGAALMEAEKPRKRAVGGDRKARLLDTKEKLFLILFYFKCYPTFDVAGVLFDLHRSRVHRWMLRLQPLLEATLGKQMVLPWCFQSVS